MVEGTWYEEWKQLKNKWESETKPCKKKCFEREGKNKNVPLLRMAVCPVYTFKMNYCERRVLRKRTDILSVKRRFGIRVTLEIMRQTVKFKLLKIGVREMKEKSNR